MKKTTWKFGVGVTALCAVILFLVPLFIASSKTKLADDGSIYTIKTDDSGGILTFDSNEIATFGAPPNYKINDPFLLKRWEVSTGKLLSSRQIGVNEIAAVHFSVVKGYRSRHFSNSSPLLKSAFVWPRYDQKKNILRKPSFSLPGKLYAALITVSNRRGDFSDLYRGGIQAWDAVNGKKIWFADEGRIEPIHHPIAFSTDGKWLVEARWSAVVIRAACTGKIIRTIKSGLPSYPGSRLPWDAITFSPDNSYLAATVTGTSGMILVWDSKTGALKWKGYEPNLSPTSISFSPNGAHIASPCYEFNRPGYQSGGAVTLWDVSNGKLIKTLTWESPADRMALAMDARKQALLRKPFAVLPSNNSRRIDTVAFSPDSKLIAVSTSRADKGEIKIWKVK